MSLIVEHHTMNAMNCIGYYSGTSLRRAVHSSHQFFGEVTNQVTNFKSPIFSVSSHQNVLYNSVTVNMSNPQSQLNHTAQFDDLKQKNW